MSAAAALITGLWRPVSVNAAEHAKVDYRDMEYERYDMEQFYALQEKVEALTEEEGKKEEVLSAYQELLDEVKRMDTLYTLCQNYYYRDVNDEYYWNESEWMYECVNTVYDEFLQTVSVILNSPYEDALVELEGEEVLWYQEYIPMTEEELALGKREEALINEYDQVLLSDAEDRYETMGEIFAELVDVRTKTAELYEYDNYADFAYENYYMRDYSTKDAGYLYSYVKSYVVPVYEKVLDEFDEESIDRLYAYEYGGEEELLDMLEPYMGSVSEKIAEAYSYMRKYHLYDWDVDEKKMQIGYTTYLSEYEAPFMFHASDGSFYDVMTLIHEFGHYNEFYQNGQSQYYELDSIDVSEVHSQALELLFLDFYDEIYGENAEDFRLYTIYSVLTSIVDGCLYDEFQCEVYKNPDMTAEEITERYIELSEQYGIRGLSVSNGSAYQWMENVHMFEQPMYYISYAVSAIAAFEIWEESIDDWKAGTETYLTFVEQGCNTGIRDAVSACGLSNVLSESTVRELADAVSEYLALEGVEYQDAGDAEEESDTFAFPQVWVIRIAAGIIILVVCEWKKRRRIEKENF